MNKIKTFILGTAAATVAATGVQAADPIFDDVKAPAREPVYRCDITGFIELPGTDICFKVGGHVQAGVYVKEDNWQGTSVSGIRPKDFAIASPYGPTIFAIDEDDFGGFDVDEVGIFGVLGEPTTNTNFWAKGRFNFDARTDTEFGTVRAFMEFQAYDNKRNTGGSPGMRHAFVQFGNWTIGKAWSTFLHLDSGPNTTDPFTVVGDHYIRRPQIRYTQPFGNGFSVSLAVEDHQFNEPDPLNSTFIWVDDDGDVIGNAPAFNGYRDRHDMPDIVAALTAEGEWGSAQLSGALTENRARSGGYIADVGPDGEDIAVGASDSDLGWGVLFGTNLAVPTTEGSNFSFKAIYTDGASHLNPTFGGSSSVIWGEADPGDPFTGGIVDTVEKWSVMGAYQHFWTPAVNTSIGAGYGEADFGDAQWVNPDPDVFGPFDSSAEFLQVWANVEWTPVSNTSFMLEAHYGSFDAGTPYVPVDTPEDTWSRFDDDAFAVSFQATRSF